MSAPIFSGAGRARTERRAFVTFLMFNDSYLPGALMAAYGLQRQRSRSDRVCLVTEEVSDGARDALRSVYDKVLPVDKIPIDPTVAPSGPVRTGSARLQSAALTRFAALRLGPDGDFGCGYDKIVSLDADLLPVRDFEALWRVPAPAGIVNERRDHMADIDAAGRLVPRPDAVRTGRWAWHDVYGDICPPGSPVPQEITDRVATDATNYGMNASLLVLEPSQAAFDDFMSWIGRGRVRTMALERWPWTDQQAATLYWSGRWTSLDPSYSLFYGHPSIEVGRGLHFAGIKPWSWRKRGFARRIQRFPDYALWGRRYLELMAEHSQLRRLAALRRLEHATRAALRH